MENSKSGITIPHSIVVEDRRRVSISGVTDVESFDEQTIVLATDEGELIIQGFNLHINRIDVEAGDLSLEGEVVSFAYTDNQPSNGGFFGKLFR